ncbi:hypothetical protein A7P25_19015 [Achromobacter xylosoxidans]|nr:hypothetical protein A7P25_19015 [Achromobacter xylosoxidans]
MAPSPQISCAPPDGIATPAPAAVLHVTVKAPVVLFTTSQRCSVVGKMICTLPVRVPDRVTMGLANFAAVNVTFALVRPVTAPMP